MGRWYEVNSGVWVGGEGQEGVEERGGANGSSTVDRTVLSYLSLLPFLLFTVMFESSGIALMSSLLSPSCVLLKARIQDCDHVSPLISCSSDAAMRLMRGEGCRGGGGVGKSAITVRFVHSLFGPSLLSSSLARPDDRKYTVEKYGMSHTGNLMQEREILMRDDRSYDRGYVPQDNSSRWPHLFLRDPRHSRYRTSTSPSLLLSPRSD